MLDWLKEFFYNLFGYFWDLFKSVMEIIIGYVVDCFLWFFEFVFWIFDAIMRFLWSLASPSVTSVYEEIASRMPSGVMTSILDSYVWFQYIDSWVPVSYCISLYIAYHGISVSLHVMRVIISYLPVGRA